MKNTDDARRKYLPAQAFGAQTGGNKHMKTAEMKNQKRFKESAKALAAALALCACIAPAKAGVFSTIGHVLTGTKITLKVTDACINEVYDKEMYITTHTQFDGYYGHFDKTGKDAVGLMNLRISPKEVEGSYVRNCTFYVTSDESAYGYYHRDSGAAESSQMGGLYNNKFYVTSTGSDSVYDIYNAVGVYNGQGTSLISNSVRFENNIIEATGSLNAYAYGVYAGGVIEIPMLNNEITAKSDAGSAYGIYVAKQSDGARLSSVGAGHTISATVFNGATVPWSDKTMAVGVYMDSAYLGELAGTEESRIKISSENQGISAGDVAVGVFLSDASNLERGVSHADIRVKSQGDYALGIGVLGEDGAANIGAISDVNIVADSERGRAVGIAFDGSYTLGGAISGAFDISAHGDVFGYVWGRDVSGGSGDNEGGISIYNGLTKDSSGVAVDWSNVAFKVNSYGASTEETGNAAYGFYISENEFDGVLTAPFDVTASGSAYGIYAATDSHAATSISGINAAISSKTTGGSAYGIYAKRASIAAAEGASVAGKLTVSVENEAVGGRGYGIYADEKSVIGNVSADIDVSVKNGNAYGIYNNGGEIGEFSGRLNLAANYGDVYGIIYGKSPLPTDSVGFYNAATNDSSGFRMANSADISVCNGFDSANPPGGNVYGLYAEGDAGVIDIGCSISVNSYGGSSINQYAVYLKDGAKARILEGAQINAGRGYAVYATGAGTEVGILGGKFSADVSVLDGAKITEISGNPYFNELAVSGPGSSVSDINGASIEFMNVKDGASAGNVKLSGGNFNLDASSGANVGNIDAASCGNLKIAASSGASLGDINVSVQKATLELSGAKAGNINVSATLGGSYSADMSMDDSSAGFIGVESSFFHTVKDNRSGTVIANNSTLKGLTGATKIHVNDTAYSDTSYAGLYAVKSNVGDILKGAEISLAMSSDNKDILGVNLYGVYANYESTFGVMDGKITVTPGVWGITAHGLYILSHMEGIGPESEIVVNGSSSHAYAVDVESINFIAGKIRAESTYGNAESVKALTVGSAKNAIEFRNGASITAKKGDLYGTAFEGNDTMRVKGDGTKISFYGNVKIYGDFVIEEGDFSFSLDELSSKHGLFLGDRKSGQSFATTANVEFLDNSVIDAESVNFYANSVDDHSQISVADGKSVSLANPDTVINLILAEDFAASAGDEILLSNILLGGMERTTLFPDLNIYLGGSLLERDKWEMFNNERGFGVSFSSAVPEPAGYAAILGALALLLAARRRKALP